MVPVMALEVTTLTFIGHSWGTFRSRLGLETRTPERNFHVKNIFTSLFRSGTAKVRPAGTWHQIWSSPAGPYTPSLSL